MLKVFRSGKHINGCSILIPRSVIERVGFFDESYVYVNDVDYFYRLVLDGCTFVCFPDELTKTRIHSEQVTVKKKGLLKTERRKLLHSLIKKTLALSEIDDEFYAAMLQCIAYYGYTDYIRAALNKRSVSTAQKIEIGYFYLKGIALKGLKSIYRKMLLNR